MGDTGLLLLLLLLYSEVLLECELVATGAVCHWWLISAGDFTCALNIVVEKEPGRNNGR